jgi:predicted transcriptional regulator of viral defense system
MANRIYSPSYISFEMALAYHQLIPESVYGVTSVSTRRTYKFNTSIAQFQYRTIKPQLFFGYVIVGYNGKTYKMATPEKAILDYLYINSKIKTKDDMAGLRIVPENFLKKIKKGTLRAYTKKFSLDSLTSRISTLCVLLGSPI